MRVQVKVQGLDALVNRLARLERGIPAKLEQTCAACANDITAAAQGLVYQDELTFQDGRIRDSLQSYVRKEGARISFGVSTNYPVAIYHEMGTGPVGTAAGYPGEPLLDGPVARRSDGWVYWSAEAAEERSGVRPGPDYSFSDMQSYFAYRNAGFVYTEGVPPKAFMHNGLMQNRDDALKRLAAAAKEALEP